MAEFELSKLDARVRFPLLAQMSIITPGPLTPSDDIARYGMGDENYNPKRTLDIVERTIQKYEKMREEKKKQFDDQYAERSDAVVSYLKHLCAGRADGGKTVDKYFGRKTLAYLRGEGIREEMMREIMIRNSMGRVVKRSGEAIG